MWGHGVVAARSFAVPFAGGAGLALQAKRKLNTLSVTRPRREKIRDRGEPRCRIWAARASRGGALMRRTILSEEDECSACEVEDGGSLVDPCSHLEFLGRHEAG